MCFKENRIRGSKIVYENKCRRKKIKRWMNEVKNGMSNAVEGEDIVGNFVAKGQGWLTSNSWE